MNYDEYEFSGGYSELNNKHIFIIGAISFGGAERVICNLANQFVENGEEVILIAVHNQGQAYYLNEDVQIINGLKGKKAVLKLISLRKILKKEKPKTVLSFMTHINIFSILSNLGLKSKVVISERTNPYIEPSQTSRRLLRKIIYPLANGVVFQTEQAKKFYPNIIQKKSMVISNPVVIDKNKLYTKKKHKVIVNVGRLIPHKRQDLLIRSFKKIHTKYPDYILEIFGEGPEKGNILELIRSLNLEDSVRLLGTTKNLHVKMSRAEFFVLSSDHEGMPNSLMEAMALGLPVISTDCPIGGPRQLIKNKINGLLVPRSDEKELYKAMELLINDKILRKKISKEATNVGSEFSLIKISAKWSDFFNEL